MTTNIRACFTFALVTQLFSCMTANSDPGTVATSAGNPIVTIGAGVAEVGGGNGWRVWYVIDTASRTCWLKLGDSAGGMDCCDLLKIKLAQPYLTWVDKNACGQPSPRPLNPPLPAPP